MGGDNIRGTQRAYPPVYDPDRLGARNSPGDNPNIRLVVPAAAVQCLFNLLFPGDDARENLDVRVRCARNTHQRRADTHYPRPPRRGYDLVGDARDGACCRRVCRRDDDEENTAVKK